MTSQLLLRVEDLQKLFPLTGYFRRKDFVHAVDGVSFSIQQGETLGLVGESGCGKTTLGRLVLRLIDSTSGAVLFQGTNVLTLKSESLKKFRKDAQIVFQNPYSSLNPRMTVRQVIAQAIRFHGLSDNNKQIEQMSLSLLARVRLEKEHMDRYPHEFSGGQRQRIAIARTLAVEPKFIVLDEPTSSLDVSVQASILNDLRSIQRQSKLTYLFISHNLTVVKYMSDKIAVMYLGKIVELATTEEIFELPLHPYTKALLSSIPVADPFVKRERIVLAGDVPSAISPPTGCRFHTRCPYAENLCKEREPSFLELRPGHFGACHIAERKLLGNAGTAKTT
jgi:oligopeptide/dipeptide ABC transporter ATP-binding protein